MLSSLCKHWVYGNYWYDPRSSERTISSLPLPQLMLVCSSHAFLSTRCPFSTLIGYPRPPAYVPQITPNPASFGSCFGIPHMLALCARFGSSGFCWYAVTSRVQRDSPDSRTRPELIGRGKHVRAKLLLYSQADLTNNDVGNRAVETVEKPTERKRRNACSYLNRVGYIA
ncbi:hypothetical protein DFH11DRAFT_891147 [Phellopilus nigrolimitatus]|nr:hypothetical protein DFH11DRAFT_891147 [Phellopilus nigrolimitatus]